jgi:SAM-dependent methyltransferase
MNNPTQYPDSTARSYRSTRTTDPRIASLIHEQLAGAHTVLNIGAGTGSYEPADRVVTAVEPSPSMRAQRSANLTRALDASAESLPFDDNAFGASMAILTVHHWPDLEAGLREMRRVTSGPAVIVTFDPYAHTEFWLSEYVPEMAEVDCKRYGPISDFEQALDSKLRSIEVPTHADCNDKFQVALYARPEAFLDPEVRAAQSAWAHLPEGAEQQGIAQLAEDLKSGRWDSKFGHMRSKSPIQCQLRILVAD